MKKVTATFNDLYMHELQMLASAETQTITVLPKLVKATETEELKRALSAHLALCREQLAVVEDLLKELHGKGEYPTCSGMASLLGECTDVLSDVHEGNLRDTVLIARMQRADHYKIAAYGSVHDYAKLLGYKEAAQNLDHATKAVSGATRTLGAIAIQVNAEAYVDTRIEEVPVHSDVAS